MVHKLSFESFYFFLLLYFCEIGCQVVKTLCGSGFATCWRLTKVDMRLSLSSLCFGREKKPRETMLHASSQIKSRFLTFCCGTRYAQTGPRNAFGTMFAHRILLTDSLAIAATMHFQFSIIHYPFVAQQHTIFSRIGEKRVLKARPKVAFCHEFSREFIR